MRFYVNDLSLAGQFADPEAFLTALREILDVRDGTASIRDNLLCSRTLGERPATAIQSFRAVVQSSTDRDLRRRILQWVGSRGPFWDDDPATVEDDLFYYASEDVTRQGLGEAARRQISGTRDATFSFMGSHFGCEEDPLVVVHGLLDAAIAEISVRNMCSLEQMRQEAHAALPAPQSWAEMLATAEVSFPGLHLSDQIAEVLAPHPFSSNVCKRTYELLGVLDQVVRSRDEQRRFTEATRHLIAERFSGTKARFTDESQANKDHFRQEMTFRGPTPKRTMLFCPFHGKINTPAYRIHFVWPLEPHQETLFVAYIGPKITR